MFEILRLLLGLGPSARAMARAHAQAIDMMGWCPSCEASFKGHLTWTLASAFSSGTPSRVAELEGLIAERQWTRAAAIMEWHGTKDEIMYVATKCPAEGKITLKKVHSVFDLSSNDRVLENVLVDEAAQLEIDALATGKWRPL